MAHKLNLKQLCRIIIELHDIDISDLSPDHMENSKILVNSMELNIIAQYGHLNLVKYFVQKGANHWNWGMMGAA